MTVYVFQPSMIWEGDNTRPDTNEEQVKIVAKSEIKARKKLPKISIGRSWVLTSATPKVKQP